MVIKEQVIVHMIFGSHLYGTQTPRSDADYKGVFMPSRKDIHLGRIPKQYQKPISKKEGEKNTSKDVDWEFYSLHYFIKMACDGKTEALDMLHAPDNMIITKTKIWDEIVTNREKFYTKNISSLVDYARGQAAKYGIKGSRVNAVRETMKFLIQFKPETRMRDIWDQLPQGEFQKEVEPSPNGIPQYEVCNRKFQATVTTFYVFDVLAKIDAEYGARARLAARNEGIDWKAVSHAIRAACQIRSIFKEGTIVYPLKESKFIRQVKSGDLDYMKVVAPALEKLMDEVEELAETNHLPEEVDRQFWDNFLYEVVDKYLCWDDSLGPHL